MKKKSIITGERYFVTMPGSASVTMRNLADTGIWLLAGLLFWSSFYPVAANGNDAAQFSERANLALRRTVHQLVLDNGDSISRIQPVQQEDANTFIIRLDHTFNYDQLPALLQRSLDIHEIKNEYNVAIRDCANGKLVLGYNSRDLHDVPCRGRSRKEGCYQLKISFIPLTTNPVWPGNPWIFPLAGVLAGIGFIVWKKSGKAHRSEMTDAPIHEMEAGITFGNSVMDLSNQKLTAGSARHNLTYREAKLLNLFVSYPNQLLDRDFILKSVWEDEGITVGRSVDVFVSRLRKMLSGDPSVKIIAVHGIGYRLEVL